MHTDTHSTRHFAPKLALVVYPTILSYPISSYLILSCPVICRLLSCPVLSCHVMSCPVPSMTASQHPAIHPHAMSFQPHSEHTIITAKPLLEKSIETRVSRVPNKTLPSHPTCFQQNCPPHRPRVSDKKEAVLVEVGRVRESTELFLHRLRQH
jgi:hypothetical protein